MTCLCGCGVNGHASSPPLKVNTKLWTAFLHGLPAGPRPFTPHTAFLHFISLRVVVCFIVKLPNIVKKKHAFTSVRSYQVEQTRVRADTREQIKHLGNDDT